MAVGKIPGWGTRDRRAPGVSLGRCPSVSRGPCHPPSLAVGARQAGRLCLFSAALAGEGPSRAAVQESGPPAPATSAATARRLCPGTFCPEQELGRREGTSSCQLRLQHSPSRRPAARPASLPSLPAAYTFPQEAPRRAARPGLCAPRTPPLPCAAPARCPGPARRLSAVPPSLVRLQRPTSSQRASRALLLVFKVPESRQARAGPRSKQRLMWPQGADQEGTRGDNLG